MRRIDRAAKRALFPGRGRALLLAAAGGAGLWAVFACGLAESPLAYAVYPLSFYALVVWTAAAVRAGRRCRQRLLRLPPVARWQTDVCWRVKCSCLLALPVNLCYAGLRMAAAVRYASPWEGALGIYAALLGGIRLLLLRRMPAADAAPDEAVRRTVRRTGWLLVGLDLALVGISVQILRDGRGYDYPGALIYAVAGYAFFCVVSAAANLVRYRRYRSPLLSAAKAVSLASALVSLLSLETAMVARFGEGEPTLHMTAATAAGVCILVLALAVYILRAAGRANES